MAPHQNNCGVFVSTGSQSCSQANNSPHRGPTIVCDRHVNVYILIILFTMIYCTVYIQLYIYIYVPRTTLFYALYIYPIMHKDDVQILHSPYIHIVQICKNTYIHSYVCDRHLNVYILINTLHNNILHCVYTAIHIYIHIHAYNTIVLCIIYIPYHAQR